MREDYVWDKTGDAESDLLALEHTLSTLRHDRPLGPLPSQTFVTGRSRPSWARPIVLGALLSSTLTVLLIWAFVRISGAPPTVFETTTVPSVIAPVAAPPRRPAPVKARPEVTEKRMAEIERLLAELKSSVAHIDAAVARIEARQEKASAPSRATRRAVSPPPEAPASSPEIPIDCILDPSKCGTKTPPKAKRVAKPSTLPDKLTSSEIKQGVVKAKNAAKACSGKHGATPGEKVVIKMTIRGETGRVTSAAATGTHAGSALGRCVAAAFAKAKFPRFRKTSLGVQYPVRMR